MSNILDKSQIEIKTFLSLVENKIKVQDMNSKVNFRNHHLCQAFNFKDLSIVSINKAIVIEQCISKVHIENNHKVKDKHKYLN